MCVCTCVCVGTHVGIRKQRTGLCYNFNRNGSCQVPHPPFLCSSMRATERPSVYTYTYTHTATSAWSTEAPSCLTHCWASGLSLLSASHLQRLGLIHMTAKWSWEQRIKTDPIRSQPNVWFLFSAARLCVCVCVFEEGESTVCVRLCSICSAKLVPAPGKQRTWDFMLNREFSFSSRRSMPLNFCFYALKFFSSGTNRQQSRLFVFSFFFAVLV